MTKTDATITTALRLSVSPEQAARYADASRRRGMPIGDWIAVSLDVAATADPNAWLKLTSGALDLRHDDIVRACRLGGYEATKSAVRGWLASHGATKIGARGQTLHRYRQMPLPAFHAFTVGLKSMLDSMDDDPQKS